MRPLSLSFVVAVLAIFLACGGQPPATYLALGDSLAVGVGASDPLSKGYVPLVHQGLQDSDRYKDRELELVNLAVSGATSADLLRSGDQLDKALAEIQGRADKNPVEVITIDIGGNDFLPLAREGSPCIPTPGPECLARFAETVGTYEKNLGQILRALRQAAPEADIVVVGLYNSLAGTPLEGAGDLLVPQANGVMARVAGEAEIGAKIADPSSLIREQPASEVIAPDQIHLTDAGYALMAEAVLDALEDQEPQASRALGQREVALALA